MEITDKAAKKILEIANDENLKPVVRVSIVGGGCAGYQHNFFFEDEKNIISSDQIIEHNGVKVVIDMVSILYMENTVVDYIDGLVGSGFKFSDPTHKAVCGCGNSFSA